MHGRSSCLIAESWDEESTVKFEEMVSELQLGQQGDALQAGWQQSQEEMPPDLPFLEPEFVRWACGQVYVPEGMAEAAAQIAERIAGSEALRRLAWHMHYRLYRAKSTQWDDVCAWPTLQASLGDEAGLFYLVVLVSNVPEMQELHRKREVPAEVVRDTLLDMRNWLATDWKAGRRGLVPMHVAWLQNHLRGDIYRLGRLQFQFGSFYYQLRAFRHCRTNVVVALAEEGMTYTLDGRRPHGEQDQAWTASLTITDTEAVGCPLHPAGRAVHRQVRLSLAEWRQELAPGDKVLHVHIPGGAPLHHEACGESFRRAMEFFARHYPEYRFATFCCSSWILNTWLEEALSPDSNLVRFQRELYLFPTSQWPNSMLHRVFGEGAVDPATAPRDTELRRAIISALEQGQDLRGGGGGMFLFPQDFGWGAQVYRSQKLPFDLGS